MNRPNGRQRGAMLVLAMIFLTVFAALGASMAIVAQGNFTNAATYEQGNRALAAAETGIRFANYRINEIAADVTTTKGSIDDTLAAGLWAELAQQIVTRMGDDGHMTGQIETVSVDGALKRVTLGEIAVGDQADAPTFQVSFEPHPLIDENYDSSYYQRDPFNLTGGINALTADGNAVSAANTIAPWWVRVRVVGQDRGVERTVRMDFRIDKKVRFAILSRSRIMIGRNVIIEGAIGSRFTDTGYLHGHPVQMRDNFHGLNATLDGWLDGLASYLADYDMDGDNRVRLADSREASALSGAQYLDVNGDGYIDTFDLFSVSYDANDDGVVSQAEFTDAGERVDEQLWQLVNEAKYAVGTEFDWDNLQVKLPGNDEWIDASSDLSNIDVNDTYAKIQGEVVMKSTRDAWEAGAAGGAYQEYYRGPIAPDPDQAATTFGGSDTDLAQFGPENFDVSSYKTMATGDFQTQVTNAVPHDPEQPTAFTPAGPGTIESVPYHSPYPYDHYARPVYENMTFTDVTIPKGTNALFVNCKFVGVTFVDAETDNADPNYNYAGMQEATGDLKYVNIEATVGGEAVEDTKSLGNNVRFDNCKFEGVVVTESPTAYTHARNKLQFTGNTAFDIDAPSLTTEQKALFEKSTILAPQFSIDMGTFTQPTSASEVTHLEGAIVAGVLDIRGQARVDGSIITTFEPTADEGPLAEGGNPANFNTTIGYFESTAGDAEAELPDGGYGRILIKYDPDRPLPDGILGPIEVRANLNTYFEGTQ